MLGYPLPSFMLHCCVFEGLVLGLFCFVFLCFWSLSVHGFLVCFICFFLLSRGVSILL